MSTVELGPVWLSLELAAVTTIVLLAIGTPLAWWLAWTHSRARPVIEALVALPLVLPPTVLGFYLLVILGPAGTIGQFWVDLTGSTLTFSFSGNSKWRMMFSVNTIPTSTMTPMAMAIPESATILASTPK